MTQKETHLLVIGCIVLMVTKFGSMKLGLKGDKPEFSSFAWFAMLFGAAIASCLGPAGLSMTATEN